MYICTRCGIVKSEGNIMETNKKRLVVEMEQDLHHEIKKQALFRNITVRKYIIQAVIERMKRDEKYQ
jgi:hypothetical protein